MFATADVDTDDRNEVEKEVVVGKLKTRLILSGKYLFVESRDFSSFSSGTNFGVFLLSFDNNMDL